MRSIVFALALAVVLVACGGDAKPPMVPDPPADTSGAANADGGAPPVVNPG